MSFRASGDVTRKPIPPTYPRIASVLFQPRDPVCLSTAAELLLFFHGAADPGRAVSHQEKNQARLSRRIGAGSSGQQR